MKNRLFPIFAAIGLMICGCDATASHNHTFSDEWSFDDTYHWHTSTCGHSEEVKDKEKHILEWTTIEEATEEKSGLKRGECSVCHYHKDIAIDKLVFNEPTYVWSEDNEYCTAKRVCKNYNDKTETETVKTVCLVITEPTDFVDGLYQYTATFTNPHFEVATKEVKIWRFNRMEFIRIGEEYSVKATSTSIKGDIVIPSIYEGLPVTSIAEWGFKGCGITSVVIPDSIKTIGSRAFYGCYHLKTVILPNLLETMLESAFEECESLESITIPGSLVNLSNYAFSYCYSLKEVIIEEGITSIGQGTFLLCSSLKTVSLPSTLKTIGKDALYDCGIEEITLPNSLETIESYAFSNCWFLYSITIPDSVTAIKRFAFSFCASLREIILPKSNNCTLESSVFAYCFSLKSAYIPSGITSIPERMFQECCSLTQVIIDSEISDLGSLSFGYCSQLFEIVDKHSSLQNLSNEVLEAAFTETTIEHIISDEAQSKLFTKDGFLGYTKDDESVLLVDYENYKCESLTIPNSFSTIGISAFYSFKELNTINFDGTVENWNNMPKGNDWNYLVPAEVVHCSNGDIALEKIIH